MELEAIAEYLDTLLGSKSYPADSNGLLVSGAKQVTKVAGSVNLSWLSLRQASGAGAGLLFAHHAAWESTDADIANAKYSFAQQAGLSIYVAHDALDRHQELGTAVSLARLLDCQVHSFFADGLGVIAFSPQDSSFAALESRVRSRVNAAALSFPSHPYASKVAVITGWGARPQWMQLARDAGADTFLSGEGIHFAKLYALETHLNLLLAGHYATEEPAVQAVIHRIGSELDVDAVLLHDRKSKAIF